MKDEDRKALEELNDTLLNVLSLNIAIYDKLESVEDLLESEHDQNRLIQPEQLTMIQRDYILKAGSAVDDLIGDDEDD